MKKNRSVIVSSDQTGAMDGLMDIAEQFQLGKTLRSIEEKTVIPAKEFRGIKSNVDPLAYRKEVVAITGKYMDEISLTHLNKRYMENWNSRPLEKLSWANLTGEVDIDITIAKTSKSIILSGANE